MFNVCKQRRQITVKHKKCTTKDKVNPNAETKADAEQAHRKAFPHHLNAHRHHSSMKGREKGTVDFSNTTTVTCENSKMCSFPISTEPYIQ